MKKHNFPILMFFISLLILISCKETKNNVVQPGDKTSALKAGYQIEPVNIQNVKLNDSFWLPIIKRVQEITIAYAIQKCNEEGRFENFLIAGKQKTGKVRGEMPFDDTDVYKIIEGASNTLISAPNPKLER